MVKGVKLYYHQRIKEQDNLLLGQGKVKPITKYQETPRTTTSITMDTCFKSPTLHHQRGKLQPSTWENLLPIDLGNPRINPEPGSNLKLENSSNPAPYIHTRPYSILNGWINAPNLIKYEAITNTHLRIIF